MRIERVGESHLSGIAVIESLCFALPWSENSLKLLTTDSAVGFAAVCDDGSVASYVGMMCVPPEGQITNVATHPSYRGHGYARQVLRSLIDYAKGIGIENITLEVRASNTPAISLYESLGFYRTGERPRFYTRPVEAAILMQKDI